MFYFGGEKPFRKRDLKQVIIKQEFAWILVAVALPLLGIGTLYLFENYTTYSSIFYAPVIIVLQIIYSLYLLWSVLAEGIKTDKAKLKKYSTNDLIYFSKVVNKAQLKRYYTGLFLYLLLMIFIIFSTL